MRAARAWRIAAVALLLTVSSCDRVWRYRVPDRPRRETASGPQYAVTAAPGVTYSVGFMWFAGQLCAYGEIHNASSDPITFHLDRFAFQDASGRRYLPRYPPGGGVTSARAVVVTPGKSFKVTQWSEDGPAQEGSFPSKRLRADAHRLLFEQKGILVGGHTAPVKLSLELEPGKRAGAGG